MFHRNSLGIAEGRDRGDACKVRINFRLGRPANERARRRRGRLAPRFSIVYSRVPAHYRKLFYLRPRRHERRPLYKSRSSRPKKRSLSSPSSCATRARRAAAAAVAPMLALARKVDRCTGKHFFTTSSLLHSYTSALSGARGSRDRSAFVYTGLWKKNKGLPLGSLRVVVRATSTVTPRAYTRRGPRSVSVAPPREGCAGRFDSAYPARVIPAVLRYPRRAGYE